MIFITALLFLLLFRVSLLYFSQLLPSYMFNKNRFWQKFVFLNSRAKEHQTRRAEVAYGDDRDRCQQKVSDGVVETLVADEQDHHGGEDDGAAEELTDEAEVGVLRAGDEDHEQAQAGDDGGKYNPIVPAARHG